jgi:hypothetical protein
MVLFARLARGMGIFDEPKNLSIVSTMAAGDIPPHHYLNSTVLFAYHYGFQLLGASLVRLGGLQPWSAFDLSKAIAGAYLFLMLALFARRYLNIRWAGPVVAGVLAFVTGTRFLLFCTAWINDIARCIDQGQLSRCGCWLTVIPGFVARSGVR